MNQALLSGIASKAYDKLLKAAESKQPIAVTGLPDTMAAYIASKLCADTGKKVLLISGNDLKAAHDAEDGQQLLETGVACLPGGEIDLTRGASSHESAWRRLEALARAQEGDIRLLCTSMDAALQRMGSADRFREETIRLAPGDRIDLNDLIRRLTAMGYERVSMVEGKGQCALRGGIIDVYPPACSQSLRIEFFDDEVDSIREFDCISQRSLDSVEKCTLTPATEVLLPAADAEKAAQRMRDAIERQGGDLTPASSTLFSDLPPLPEDDADAPDFFDKNITPKIREKQQTAARKAELERRRTQLMADADMLAEGLPFKRIRAWLPVLTDDTYTVLDWFEPEIVVLSDPNLLRKRAEERRAGFAEDLEGAMSRDEAVKEQETLLMDWDELLRHVQGYATVAVTEFLEGMAGVAVKDAAAQHRHAVALAQPAVTVLRQRANLRGISRDALHAKVGGAGRTRCRRVVRGENRQAAGRMCAGAARHADARLHLGGSAPDCRQRHGRVRHGLPQGEKASGGRREDCGVHRPEARRLRGA